jgi:hypothetical protein
MTATAVTHPRRFSGDVPLWPSVVAFAALLVALSVYLVVTLSSSSPSRPAGPATKAGSAGGQYNQVCVPAPSTRFC